MNGNAGQPPRSGFCSNSFFLSRAKAARPIVHRILLDTKKRIAYNTTIVQLLDYLWKGKMAMAEKKRLTEDGLKKLELELEELKTVKRKEIAEKIKIALSFGDLSENSEYDEAKNEQAIIESKITQLEAMLKNVEVVDTDELSTEHIGVGSKVRLKDIEFDEEVVYHIVGSAEADPMDNKISDESPMGKALLGHKQGDDVQVEAPAGMIHFQVMEIFK